MNDPHSTEQQTIRPHTANRTRYWPGMPSRRSKLMELFFAAFPIWVALVGFVVAGFLSLLMSLNK